MKKDRCFECKRVVRDGQDKDWCVYCMRVFHAISEEVCGGSYTCVCGEAICRPCKMKDAHCEGSKEQ